MKLVSCFRFVFIISVLVSCSNAPSNTNSILSSNPSHQEEDISQEPSNSDQGRAIWQKPNVVLEKLGDLSDKVVCDLGAGSGYFTFKLAPRAKKVIAVDIDREALHVIDSLKFKLPTHFYERIETRLADANDPNLKKDEVDVILIINTIPYISDIKGYLCALKNFLKHEGQIVIVDYKMKRLPIDAPETKFRVYPNVLEDYLYECDYTDVAVDDTSLDFQYIISAKQNLQ
ncbi:MAG: methyltransferase domain-containing protein [Saprospiraceae bacterium]|nr:methyltransferase domain-containing protein [Saprospiraceae bacterium]